MYSTQPVEICTRDNHRLKPGRHFRVESRALRPLRVHQQQQLFIVYLTYVIVLAHT